MEIKEAYISSDYAGLRTSKYNFYLGYEHTICSKHGDDAEIEDGCEECEDNWAFVVWDSSNKNDLDINGNGKEIFRLPKSELEVDNLDGENLFELLAIGILKFYESLNI